MQMILNGLNAVPGVVGSMVFDEQGQVVAHQFPTLFDTAVLSQAGRIVSDGLSGVAPVTGPVRMMDFRFEDARILVRPLSRASLLFLCSPSINLQPLLISASVAAAKVERLLSGQTAAGSSGLGSPAPGNSGLGAAANSMPTLSGLSWSTPGQVLGAGPGQGAAPPAPVSQMFAALERVDAIIARRNLDRSMIRGAIAMKAGFGLGSIDAETPDDPGKLASLKAAAAVVLGERV
jgi:predicted regulator of Ras-like GTPase activity (Roadblock/LC7/MglB family)